MVVVIEKFLVMESSGKRESEGKWMKMMNNGEKFSTTHVTRTVLTDSGVVWKKLVYRFLDDLNLDSCIHPIIMFFV